MQLEFECTMDDLDDLGVIGEENNSLYRKVLNNKTGEVVALKMVDLKHVDHFTQQDIL